MNSQVNFTTVEATNNQANDKGFYHKPSIINLEENTKYVYRVV